MMAARDENRRLHLSHTGELLSAKEEIMGRIRRALSDTPGHQGEETPALERPQPLRPDDGDLAGQFRAEMEKLGGRVTDAGSEEQINQYIEGLLAGQTGSSVAVSDAVSNRWPSICSRIRAKGIEIVPSLRVFARAPTVGRAKTAARVEAGQELLFADGPEEQAASNEASGSAAEANGSAADLMERYKLSLFDAAAGITTADYAIADTGTLVLLSKKSLDPSGISGIPSDPAEGARQRVPQADGEQHRLISLVPPIHVCLLDRSRIVANLTDLLSLVHKELYLKGGPPLAMTFISGPSRTADIELTLTKGVHGPREVHVLLCG
jgi:L-lactate utilization protein LutC